MFIWKFVSSVFAKKCNEEIIKVPDRGKKISRKCNRNTKLYVCVYIVHLIFRYQFLLREHRSNTKNIEIDFPEKINARWMLLDWRWKLQKGNSKNLLRYESIEVPNCSRFRNFAHKTNVISIIAVVFRNLFFFFEKQFTLYPVCKESFVQHSSWFVYNFFNFSFNLKR